MTNAGKRLVLEVVLVALIVFGLGVLSGLLLGCASGPTIQADYLDRGIVSCNVIPSDGVRPCIIELETSDEKVFATLRGMTGCVVRTRQTLRQPDFGVF
jgi:hypothetical protein